VALKRNELAYLYFFTFDPLPVNYDRTWSIKSNPALLPGREPRHCRTAETLLPLPHQLPVERLLRAQRGVKKVTPDERNGIEEAIFIFLFFILCINVAAADFRFSDHTEYSESTEHSRTQLFYFVRIKRNVLLPINCKIVRLWKQYFCEYWLSCVTSERINTSKITSGLQVPYVNVTYDRRTTF
jgi:hypothetical protein